VSAQVKTITITAELTDGTKVSAVQVGLDMVPEEQVDRATVVADAIYDGGAQLRNELDQKGLL